MSTPPNEMAAAFEALAVTESIQKEIDETGYAIISAPSIKSDQPPFCYTIGLSEKGWPELFFSGFMAKEAYAIAIQSILRIWEETAPAFGRIENVMELPDGTKHPVLIAFQPGESLGDKYLMLVNRFLNHSFDVAQVFLADRGGFFPTDTPYEPHPMMIQDTFNDQMLQFLNYHAAEQQKVRRLAQETHLPTIEQLIDRDPEMSVDHIAATRTVSKIVLEHAAEVMAGIPEEYHETIRTLVRGSAAAMYSYLDGVNDGKAEGHEAGFVEGQAAALNSKPKE